MIEINARLSRGAVYFRSETIKCVVTLTNVTPVPVSNHHNRNHNDKVNHTVGTSNGKAIQPKDSDFSETLCWAGVQLHCYCSVDETKVVQNESPLMAAVISSTDTSFNPCLMKGEKGRVLFSSSPKILFCDLKLMPNESKSFVYNETVPDWVPPSYNGLKVKYQYKLSIGTQRINSSIQLLRIPIRILTIDIPIGLVTDSMKINHQNYELNNDCNNDINRKDSVVSNHSVNHTYEPIDFSNESVLDVSLHRLDCLTAKRCPQSYVITNPFGKVAKLCIMKSTYKLGEDIVGIFSFNESTVPCVQFSVTLQCDETIQEEYRVKDLKPSSYTQTTSYSNYNEFCLHMNHTQMVLTVPLTITPTFTSDLVSLSWKLHFEFVTAKPEDVRNTVTQDSQGVSEQSPPFLNVQTMVWDLPICLFATHPIQVARGFQMPAASTLTV
ncbi:RAB6A-GEF complex partner protein 2-like [Oppia nitens]|uniref:RAB6A-GEF complex partner protein 2-like n=1 Tax=Oppia nitens TaxID=1686743 RepID=UPI0023DAB797|nr:RAB6A-GEF complex partner protein 2-like [Oppia nitens]